MTIESALRSPTLRSVLLWTVLVVTVFVPRLIALDAFAVQDEYLWMYRGSLYLDAVRNRQWDYLHTYPPFSLHPGAPLLWLTSGLLTLYRDTEGLQGLSFDAWPIEAQRGAAALTRAGLGATTGVLLLALAALLRQTRLFGPHPVWIAGTVALLGLEPWVLGMSRAVHLDALLSLFLLLAVVASVVARERASWRWTLGAGALWGLAFMTKSPAVNFLPVVLLPFVLRPFSGWRTSARALAAWGAGALAVILASWPPMWFHPILRFRDILADMFSHVQVPEVYLWPGVHPPLFLTLLSPAVLGGLGLYLILRAIDLARGRRDRSFLATDLILAGGALFAALLLAVGGDHARKNLPILTFLALPGIVGWFLAARRLRVPAGLVVAGLLVAQLATLRPWFPHLPSYHNALLGSEGRRLLVDIGNGARLVADHFNAREPVVFATNLPGLIQPYLREDRRDTVRRLPRSGRLQDLDADAEYLVIPESFPARVNFDVSAKGLLNDLGQRTPEAVLSVRDVPLFSIVRAR